MCPEVRAPFRRRRIAAGTGPGRFPRSVESVGEDPVDLDARDVVVGVGARRGCERSVNEAADIARNPSLVRNLLQAALVHLAPKLLSGAVRAGLGAGMTGKKRSADGLRWPRAVAHLAIVVVFVVAALGYAPLRERAAGAARPHQAGQPLSPLVTAAHIVAARADVMTGDADGAKAHVDAIAHDLMRSARVADVTRPIDHEAARAAVRSLQGVRSAIWLDQANLAVMVAGAADRSMATIDRVCDALAPLGDTLAVVVHVQNAAATTADDATTLSRNCQLPEGQLAFMQRKRGIDVVPPELRRTFKAQQAR